MYVVIALKMRIITIEFWTSDQKVAKVPSGWDMTKIGFIMQASYTPCSGTRMSRQGVDGPIESFLDVDP